MSSTARTPLALAAVSLLSVAGIVAAVSLGGHPDQDPATVVDTDTSAVAVEEDVAETERTEDTLARTRLNTVHTGAAPDTPDTWGEGRGHHEYFRSWEGTVTVWRGGLPQLVLGPEGNWFPAGQPGCGDGVHVITFDATAPVTVQLQDAAGEAGVEKQVELQAESGWLIADDCHLPYLAHSDVTDPEAPSTDVSYTVHEYQRAPR